MKNKKQEWSIPKEIRDRLNEDKKKGLYRVIDDFYAMGGAASPVKNLNELLFDSIKLRSILIAQGEDGPGAANTEWFENSVFIVHETINFISELYECWENHPCN